MRMPWASILISLLLAGTAIARPIHTSTCPLPFSEISAPEYRSHPIPAGPEAPTAPAWDAIHRELMSRALMRDRAASAGGSSFWATNLVAFFDDFAAYHAGGANAPSWQQVADAGQALLQAGCRSPLLLYGMGTLWQDAGDAQKAKDFLLPAAVELDDGHCGQLVRCLIAERMAHAYSSRGRVTTDLSAQWRQRACDALVATATQEELNDDQQRFLFLHAAFLLDQVYPPDEALLDRLARTNGVPPWLDHMIKGCSHAALGWHRRGSAYAADVTSSQWADFEGALQLARAAFEAAHALHPEFPEAATAMIPIAMASRSKSGETPRTWFDRAVAAQLDYIGAYDRLRISLFPRWGGSHEAMYAFGQECLATARFDTEVPYQFLLAVRDIETDTQNDGSYWQKPETFASLERMFQGYLEAYTDPEGLANVRTKRVVAAWKCGHHERAAQLLAAWEADLRPGTAEDTFGVSLDKVRADLSARLAHWRANYDSACLTAKTNRPAAIEQLRSLLREYANDGTARRVMGGQVQTWEYEEQHQQGHEVAVEFDPALSCWDVMAGGTRVDAQGGLVMTSSDKGSRVDFAPLFQGDGEMSVDIEFLGGVGNGFLRAGLCVRTEGWSSPALNLRLCQNDRTAGLRVGHFAIEDLTADISLRPTNTVELRVEKGKVSVRVNGQAAFGETPLPSDCALRAYRVSLQADNYFDGALIRFAHLRVRRLDAPDSARPGSPSEKPPE